MAGLNGSCVYKWNMGMGMDMAWAGNDEGGNEN